MTNSVEMVRPLGIEPKSKEKRPLPSKGLWHSCGRRRCDSGRHCSCRLQPIQLTKVAYPKHDRREASKEIRMILLKQCEIEGKNEKEYCNILRFKIYSCM
jgi:hypothetical protein